MRLGRPAVLLLLMAGLAMSLPPSVAQDEAPPSAIAGDDPVGDLAWTGFPIPPSPGDDRFRTADLLRLALAQSGDGVRGTIDVRPRTEGPELPVAGSVLFRVHLMVDGEPYHIVLERSRPLWTMVDDKSYVTALLCREGGGGVTEWPCDELQAWDDIAAAQIGFLAPTGSLRGAIDGVWVESRSFSGILDYGLTPQDGDVPDEALPAVGDRLPDSGTLPGVLVALAERVPEGNGSAAMPLPQAASGQGPARGDDEGRGVGRDVPGVALPLTLALVVVIALLRRSRG